MPELSVQHPDHDHFLNAAYFHLYCIERFLNFPEICAKLNVSAEGRDARKEKNRKNRFRLGLSEEEKVVQDFVEANGSSNSQSASNIRVIGGNPWVAHLPRPSPDQSSLPYRGTLSHQLVLTKLHYGGRGRINLRKNREDKAGYEGSNITRHLGDLRKEAELRQYSRTHKNQNRLKPPQAQKKLRQKIPKYQTRRAGLGTDEFVDPPDIDGDHQDVRMATPSETSPRTTRTPKSRPVQNHRYASIHGLPSTMSEDQSDDEIALEILAAQRRRRALEIEDAKDKEKELKLKLQKAEKRKRVEDGADSIGKRQRV